jgi:hypothetical protein
MRFQRAAAPDLGNDTEEAVYDLVPFARTRRKMTDMYREANFIG